MRRFPIVSWMSIVLLVVVIAASAWASNRQNKLTQQGVETHDALCVFKGDLEKRVASSRTFLAMTPEERVEKYGTALGSVPESFVRNSLRNQQQAVESLRVLDCT